MLWILAQGESLVEWQIPEYITVGGVLFMMISMVIVVFRTRTDPKLLDFMRSFIEGEAGERKEITGNVKDNSIAIKELTQVIRNLSDLLRTENTNAQLQRGEILNSYKLFASQIADIFGKSDTKLDTLLAAHRTHNDLATSTHTGIEEIKTTMKTDSERLEDLSAKIDALIAKHAELVSKVDVLQSAVINEVTTIKGEVASQQLGLRTVQAEVNDMKKRAADEHPKADPEPPVIEQPVIEKTETKIQ